MLKRGPGDVYTHKLAFGVLRWIWGQLCDNPDEISQSHNRRWYRKNNRAHKMHMGAIVLGCDIHDDVKGIKR